MQARRRTDCLKYMQATKKLYSIITDLIDSGALLRGQTSLPGDHRELEPPDPIPNSVVKWFIADGSVGLPHVRVGHCQASK